MINMNEMKNPLDKGNDLFLRICNLIGQWNLYDYDVSHSHVDDSCTLVLKFKKDNSFFGFIYVLQIYINDNYSQFMYAVKGRTDISYKLDSRRINNPQVMAYNVLQFVLKHIWGDLE